MLKRKPEDSESKPNVLGVPLTKWAIGAVSLIFVAYVAIHYGNLAWTEVLESHRAESRYSVILAQEMDAHKKDKGGERTTIHKGPSGQVDQDIVATYFSDGCISIERPGEPLPYLTHAEANVEWSLSPSRRPAPKAPKLPSATPIYGATVDVPGEVPIATEDLFGTYPFSLSQLRPVQGSCLNPHPWPFGSWWGPANGCWIPLFRRWNDGCQHYQMYNTCAGQWDPQIHWTFCVPQHHP